MVACLFFFIVFSLNFKIFFSESPLRWNIPPRCGLGHMKSIWRTAGWFHIPSDNFTVSCGKAASWGVNRCNWNILDMFVELPGGLFFFSNVQPWEWDDPLGALVGFSGASTPPAIFPWLHGFHPWPSHRRRRPKRSPSLAVRTWTLEASGKLKRMEVLIHEDFQICPGMKVEWWFKVSTYLNPEPLN